MEEDQEDSVMTAKPYSPFAALYYHDPNTWPEPVDVFEGDNVPPPSLQEHHLPLGLAPYTFDVARRLGVDPAAVAICCIVVCSAAIDEQWRIRPKQHDTEWQESARLWAAIVGDPSTRKSPIISAATKILDRIEKEWREDYARALADYEAQCERLQQEKVPKAEWPAAPRQARILIEDCTIEALSEVLRDDAKAKLRAPLGKVLVRRDELEELIVSMDRYRALSSKGSADRGAYLRLYNGGSFLVDRVQRGSIYCPSWSACLLGGIQPEPLRRIAHDAQDDGLLQRFMLIVPGQEREEIDEPPDEAAREMWQRIVRKLVTTRPSERATIGLSDGAQRERKRTLDLSRALAQDTMRSKRLASHFAKWAGLYPRLLLTFHMIEFAAQAICDDWPGPPPLAVSEDTARRCSLWMTEILLPHALRAEDVIYGTPGIELGRYLAGLILTNAEVRRSQRLTLRTIQHTNKRLRGPEARLDINVAMQWLETAGWARADEGRYGELPHAWQINPTVYERFAERAKTEAMRREEIRMKIIADARQLSEK